MCPHVFLHLFISLFMCPHVFLHLFMCDISVSVYSMYSECSSFMGKGVFIHAVDASVASIKHLTQRYVHHRSSCSSAQSLMAGTKLKRSCYDPLEYEIT